MSKLSEFQIRALIPGMESTLAKYEREGRAAAARRTRQRLEVYRAEVAALETAQLEQSQTTLSSAVSTNPSSKTAQVLPFFGGHMEKKNALQVAGDDLAAGETALFSLGQWTGRRQAFGMLAAKCSAADAQCLKRLKQGGEYKALGLTWEQFCVAHLGVTRPTADRIIASFDEFGAAYFNLAQVTRISPTNFRQIAGAISETEIEVDGEKIPITKTHAARIADAIESLRKAVEAKEELVQEKVRDAKKLREERDNARKAAEKEHQRLLDHQKAETERFRGAGEDYSILLDAQSKFDLAMAKLATVGSRDLSLEDQARFIGECEYMYRQLIQVSYDARLRFGKGWNMADGSDLLTLNEVAPSARNLMDEFAKKHK